MEIFRDSPVHKQMYLSYGAEQTTFVSLVPRTGQVLWAWMAPARAGILGVDGRQVLISIQQNGLSAIAALSMVTGRELWQADLRAGYYSLTEDGSLFWMESSRLTALEPATGQVLWSYAGEPNHHLWLSFEKNGLYVHERSRISSLDRRNGRVVWVHHYNVPAAMNPHAEILESGVVLVQILDHTSRVSRQIALNCWTGQVIWEREDTGTSSFMSEGNQQGAWRINGKVLQAVDPWTGTVRWSFTLNSTVSTENILKVLEQDKNTVYVGYGRVSDRDPPMGVLALDMKTGALLWQSWLDATLSRVGGDGRTLILNAGPHGTTKALLK
jgi:outer membrane protein assembly factor BamB